MTSKPDIVTLILSARACERYMRAVEGQGLGFVELRTPPWSLPVDDRGVIKGPPAELFGEGRRPHTAGVLSGELATTWGWPR